MENFYIKLREYFKNTSQEQVLKDWAKSRKYDKIGPNITEYLDNTFCKCKGGPIGRSVTEDFEYQICEGCGKINKTK